MNSIGALNDETRFLMILTPVLPNTVNLAGTPKMVGFIASSECLILASTLKSA